MLSPDLTEVGNQIPYIHIFSYRGLMAELVISGMNVLRQTVEGYLRDVAQIFLTRGGKDPRMYSMGWLNFNIGWKLYAWLQAYPPIYPVQMVPITILH